MKNAMLILQALVFGFCDIPMRILIVILTECVKIYLNIYNTSSVNYVDTFPSRGRLFIQ